MPERTRTDAARRGAVASQEARVASDVIGTAEEAHANVSAQQRPRRSFLRSRWDILLVISMGGALGSLARWGVGELLPWSGEDFPWATFIENVSGGFLLGILMVLLLDVLPPRRYLRPFLGVGLLGGYTTFSTYMLEARELLYSGHVVTAVAYLGGSLLVGLNVAKALSLAWGLPLIGVHHLEGLGVLGHHHDGQRAVGIGDELEADGRRAEVHQALERVGRDAAEVEGRDEHLLLLHQRQLVQARREHLHDEIHARVEVGRRGRDGRRRLDTHGGEFGMSDVVKTRREGAILEVTLDHEGQLVSGRIRPVRARGRSGSRGPGTLETIRLGVSDISACGMAHLSCVLADACIHDPARTGAQVGALAAFRQAPPGTPGQNHALATALTRP